MRLNRKNESLAFDQAQRIMQILEQRCEIWNLRVRDIPIWWFVRNRFYAQLIKHFDIQRDEVALTNDASLFDGLSHLFSACSKSIVFGLRSLSGMIQMRRGQFHNRQVLFLSTAALFRGVGEDKISDIYLGPIYSRVPNKGILVERTTLSKHDLHSLLFRRDCVFFDWMLLRATFRLLPFLRQPLEVKNWRSFCARCKQMNLDTISSERLLGMVKSTIDRFSRKAIIQVEAAKMLLEAMSPRQILETCSYDSSCMAINLIARRRGIRIMELQHGFISKFHMGYAYFLPGDYQGEKPIPDKIMVYGEAFKEAVLGGGTAFDSENVVVTGFPRLSEFLKRLKEEGRASLREEVRHRLGIAQDAFVLTVTTQPQTSSSLCNFLRESLQSIRENDFTICMKVHPSEVGTWKSSYKSIIRDPRVKVLTDKNIDLYELLVASDVHATVYSTVFLESFALGVPNVIIGCPGYQHVLELVDEAEIVLASDIQTFVAELRKLAKGSAYSEEIVRKGMEAAKRFFAMDGSPVEQIRREIEEV